MHTLDSLDTLKRQTQHKLGFTPNNSVLKLLRAQAIQHTVDVGYYAPAARTTLNLLRSSRSSSEIGLILANPRVLTLWVYAGALRHPAMNLHTTTNFEMVWLSKILGMTYNMERREYCLRDMYRCTSRIRPTQVHYCCCPWSEPVISIQFVRNKSQANPHPNCTRFRLTYVNTAIRELWISGRDKLNKLRAATLRTISSKQLMER